jgi:hypothetical protein
MVVLMLVKNKYCDCMLSRRSFAFFPVDAGCGFRCCFLREIAPFAGWIQSSMMPTQNRRQKGGGFSIEAETSQRFLNRRMGNLAMVGLHLCGLIP